VACARSRIDALDDPVDPAADHGAVVIAEVKTQVEIGIGLRCLFGRWGNTIRSISIWLMLCTTIV
jgi:RNase P/RNase MRP subunit p30